ncbi:LCP family protein [Isachenkonia alkalipeptolytica]|uniref:LCP family protein n=1 Tax=Isachenkonia alkalipeptolytica TaxID=2565777 RepID=UPI0013695F2E|nr:LCP family protein [Isachenkonia alkalipeptolytica]
MPRKKRKSISRRKKMIRRILVIVGLIVAIPILVYGARIYNLYNTVHQSLDDEEFEAYEPEETKVDEDSDDDYEEDVDAESMPEDEVEAMKFVDDPFYEAERSEPNPDHLNFLLMGVDDNHHRSSTLSDTIMVIHFNTKTEEAAILSIPRDTFVRIPDRGYDKINHSSAFGGTRLLKETTERYLDIHIDHYIRLDMVGLRASIDSIGGIQIDVPYRMVQHDGKHLFDPGPQHMTGRDVFHYVSARKLIEGEGSDFGRIKRQQQVVMELLRIIREDLSLNQTLNLMEDVSPYMRMDIGPGLVANHWNAFNRLNLNAIEIETLSGDSIMHQGVYYYRVPIEDARETMKSLTQ